MCCIFAVSNRNRHAMSLTGIRTKIHTDVKSDVVAGMEFLYTKGATKSGRMQKVGYDIVRIYYDSIDKDCFVGHERIKRVFFNR
jgi:hypothetical protein